MPEDDDGTAEARGCYRCSGNRVLTSGRGDSTTPRRCISPVRIAGVEVVEIVPLAREERARCR